MGKIKEFFNKIKEKNKEEEEDIVEEKSYGFVYSCTPYTLIFFVIFTALTFSFIGLHNPDFDNSDIDRVLNYSNVSNFIQNSFKENESKCEISNFMYVSLGKLTNAGTYFIIEGANKLTHYFYEKDNWYVSILYFLTVFLMLFSMGDLLMGSFFRKKLKILFIKIKNKLGGKNGI